MRSFAFRRTLLNIVAVSLVLMSANLAVQARSDCHFERYQEGFTGSMVIKGCPAKVFAAIKNSRNSERRRVVSTSGNCVVLEEKFASLPIIGPAMCKYQEVDVHNKRIDYKIVHSKQFKRFDGKWELCPVNEDKATLVKLTSCVDTYIKVPFAKRITDHGTKKDIRRRLSDIKRRVEVGNVRQISYARK